MITRPLARSIAVALLGAPLLLPAQGTSAYDERVARADSLIQLALDQTRAGDTTSALRALERATRVAPNYAAAHYHRGRLLARTTRLGMSDVLRRREATQQLNRALDLDNNNPFYMLELGRVRLKTPFLRLDAERLFNRALKAAVDRRDPGVLADVQWELGQIYERRFATMANRRMITGNASHFNVNEALSDWHYTRDFLADQAQPVESAGELDFRKAEDYYRAALAADPAHAGAAIGLLGLLCEAGRYEEMLQAALAARRAQPRAPRVLLAMGLALHRLDRDVDAEPVFDSALALMPAGERAQMTGLETIMRVEHARTYRGLGESGRLQQDSLYWNLADPLALTAVNEARVEFLARVAYADLRFSSPEFGTVGWRTDRGITYIRYGPPPQIATFSPLTQEIESSDAGGRVTTVWYYPETKLRFVFLGPPAMNSAYFAGDFRAYAENARHVAPVSFGNLAALLRVDSIPVQVARFRGNGAGAVDVAIFADVPTRRMLRDVDLRQVSVETALFISDTARRRVVAAGDSTVVRADARDPVTSRSWRRQLAPGQYSYRVEAREQASGRSARGFAMLDADPFAAGTLRASDILVARHISPRAGVTAVRGLSDFLVTPNASLQFAPGDSIFLYWEMYGLTADAQGNARMRVELAVRVSALNRGQQLSARLLGGLFDAVGLSEKGDDRVSLRFERSLALDSSDRVPNYLALGLGDAPAGTYLVELTVTDLVSGRATTRERTITIPLR